MTPEVISRENDTRCRFSGRDDELRDLGDQEGGDVGLGEIGDGLVGGDRTLVEHDAATAAGRMASPAARPRYGRAPAVECTARPDARLMIAAAIPWTGSTASTSSSLIARFGIVG